MMVDIVDTSEHFLYILLKDAVKRAWKKEAEFHKTVFKKELKENDSVCQGMCRQIISILGEVFDDTRVLSIQVKRKTHLVVFVSYAGFRFILDGTIKQFLLKEKETVFLYRKYPFKKQLSKAKEWTQIRIM